MIAKAELMKQLEAFEEAKGKPVMVHSSMRAVGDVEGGKETVLSALIEYFTGEGGLLCVPSHTWDDKILDMRETYTHLGALPSMAVAHPDGTRTEHPTHSMVVFGDAERVKAFVEGEEKVHKPVAPDGCHGKLYREEGYVLLLGVGFKSCTYLHCAEEMVGIPGRITDDRVERVFIDREGNEIKRMMHAHVSWAMRHIDYNKLEAAFRYHDGVTDGMVGDAKTMLGNAKIIKDTLEMMYERNGKVDFVTDGKPLDEKLYK